MSPTALESDHAEQLLASLWSDPFIGSLAQIANPGVPARSNATIFGRGGLADGALAATGVCCAVAVPVVAGDIFTKVRLVVGAQAAVTPTHSFAAVYANASTPALLGQSTDGGAAAIAAGAPFDFTLASPIQVTWTGFAYADISVTAATIPTAAVASTPTAIGYPWVTGDPLGLSLTHGSAVAGTAPATITGQAAKAVAPIVILY